jgi:uncharacterized metal-binding protein
LHFAEVKADAYISGSARNLRQVEDIGRAVAETNTSSAGARRAGNYLKYGGTTLFAAGVGLDAFQTHGVVSGRMAAGDNVGAGLAGAQFFGRQGGGLAGAAWLGGALVGAKLGGGGGAIGGSVVPGPGTLALGVGGAIVGGIGGAFFGEKAITYAYNYVFGPSTVLGDRAPSGTAPEQMAAESGSSHPPLEITVNPNHCIVLPANTTQGGSDPSVPFPGEMRQALPDNSRLDTSPAAGSPVNTQLPFNGEMRTSSEIGYPAAGDWGGFPMDPGYGDWGGLQDAVFDDGGSVWSPVVLDLDGDGVEIRELGSSNTFFDMAGDGYKHRTAWAGLQDGVLAIDADGDGKIDQQKEIVFTEWDPTATSDMQALRNIFDTNHNGQLDAGDERFADFRLVITRVDDTTGVRTLTDAGVASIDLTEDKNRRDFSDGSSIDGQTTYTRTDGTTRAAATVTFAADAEGHAIRTTKTVNPDGSTTVVNRMLAADGSLASEILSKISSNGLTRTMTFDNDGDGVVDRRQTDVTVVNGDGSRTQTLSNSDQAGVLLDRTVTTTSSDRMTVTISRDTNGNGVADQRELRVRAANGSTSATVTNLIPNGTTQSESVYTVNVLGTAVTRLDIDGDGTIDLTRIDGTVTDANGARTRTVREDNTDGSVRSRTVTISSADGSSQTVKIDANGDGANEVVRTSTIVRNANGSTTTTDLDKSGNGSLIASKTTTISADGLSVTTARDLDGNGTADVTVSDVTVLSGSNRVQTIRETAGNGDLLSKTTITKGAADGLTRQIRADTDGDGNDDRVEQISVSGGVVTNTLTTYSPNGAVVTSRAATVTSADGLTQTISSDYDGDNANDLIRTIATVTNANGSSTVTTSDRARNNALIGKTETTTSADALTVTSKSNIDGDTTYDFTTTSVTVVAENNAITKTETTTSEDGTRQSRRLTNLNAARTSSLVREDVNGDAKFDRSDGVVKQNNGVVVQTLSTFSRDETLTSKIVTTTSADGLTVSVASDFDGDGTTDLTGTDVTVLGADGSRTNTVSVEGPAGELRHKLVTTTTASGLSTTIREDLDGNGSFDRTTTDVTTIASTGVREQTVIYKAGTKVIGSKVIETSRTGLSVTTETDADGDGDVDTKTTDVTVLATNGSKTRAVTNLNLDLSMRDKVQTVTTGDGRSVTVRNDMDGSGSWDRIETIVKQADGQTVDTITGYDFTTGAKNFSLSKTTRADGTYWIQQIDENGDGLVDEYETSTLVYNADGSTKHTYTDYNDNANRPFISWPSGTPIHNSLIQTTTTSADGLSKVMTVVGNNALIDSGHTTSDVTVVGADGGTVRTMSVLGQSFVEAQRRITTDAHGFSRLEELDIGRDGVIEATDLTIVNANGSKTNSYTSLNYKYVVQTSADGLTIASRRDTNLDGAFDLFETATKLSDGSTVNIVESKTAAGALRGRSKTTTSFDERTITVQHDTDGNGTFDLTQSTISVINADGSTTTTRSDTSTEAGLRSRIASTTSANGLSTTASIDLNGDGVVDQTFSDITTIAADGSTTRVAQTVYSDASLKNRTRVTTSADGLRTTTQQDVDGNGVYDFVTTEVGFASGRKLTTVSRYSSSGVLTSRDYTEVSATGRIIAMLRDTDGNGTTDRDNRSHRVADIGGSYTATLQDFLYSDPVSVVHQIDEIGVDRIMRGGSFGYSLVVVGSRKDYDEYQTKMAALYDVVLDRDPGQVEQELLNPAQTWRQRVTSLLARSECTQRYGTLTNAQFVEQMYRNAYDRGASVAEMKSWLDRMAGGTATREDVVLDLWQSAEHVVTSNIHRISNNTFNVTGNFEFEHTTDKSDAKNIIDRLYVTTIASHVGDGNINTSLLLSGGITKSQVAANLLGSTAFQNKYGTLSDQNFVNQMFLNGLDRAPTTQERTSWATLIANGTISRADFVVAIADSPEYEPGLPGGQSAVMFSSAGAHAEGAILLAPVPSQGPTGDGVLRTTDAPRAQTNSFGGSDQASMLRLVQAMASMAPQGAAESTLPVAAIPIPTHQLASPLH